MTSIFMAATDPQPPHQVLVKLPEHGFTTADCKAFAAHAGYRFLHYWGDTPQDAIDFPGLLDKKVPDYRDAIFDRATVNARLGARLRRGLHGVTHPRSGDQPAT
jgi:hypothetical protein